MQEVIAARLFGLLPEALRRVPGRRLYLLDAQTALAVPRFCVRLRTGARLTRLHLDPRSQRSGRGWGVVPAASREQGEGRPKDAWAKYPGLI